MWTDDNRAWHHLCYYVCLFVSLSICLLQDHVLTEVEIFWLFADEECRYRAV